MEEDALRTQRNERDKEVVSKNCAPITYFIREINNYRIDNAKDITVVMLMVI